MGGRLVSKRPDTVPEDRIERAAIAMRAVWAGDRVQPWEALGAFSKREWTNAARAALEAAGFDV